MGKVVTARTRPSTAASQFRATSLRAPSRWRNRLKGTHGGTTAFDTTLGDSQAFDQPKLGATQKSFQMSIKGYKKKPGETQEAFHRPIQGYQGYRPKNAKPYRNMNPNGPKQKSQ